MDSEYARAEANQASPNSCDLGWRLRDGWQTSGRRFGHGSSRWTVETRESRRGRHGGLLPQLLSAGVRHVEVRSPDGLLMAQTACRAWICHASSHGYADQ